jgi:hypothetical protein
MKYAEMTWGTMEAVINRLGGMDGVRRFLQGELVVTEPGRRWREQDGMINFSVTSDGTTGRQWVERLGDKGFGLSKWAKDVLHSSHFEPTRNVTYEVSILKGMLFNDDDRTTKNIRREAHVRNLIEPNAEIACLTREIVSDVDLEAMGIWWVTVMHEPIKDSAGHLRLLTVGRGDSGNWLRATHGRLSCGWRRARGFAFCS